MYSWKDLRTVCAVLLLVPIVHLVYLVSQELRATLDTSPEVWADEVAIYAQMDQSTPLPKEPVVVLGGRRVKLWRGLQDLLAPLPVLMRGIGEATINDVTHYYSQLAGFYGPGAVVLLPGISEFHVRDSKSAEELLSATTELVELDHTHRGTRHFYVFTPVKTPLFPKDDAKIEEVTRLLEDWAEMDEGVTILDANPLLTLSNGSPNPDFYRFDGINLNEHGYLRLSMLLRDQLEKDGLILQARGNAR